ncbi:hypothetical protein V0288_01475 [Pannus brasiliensis CCIBt3594]|uniref:Uncharacterized protein n=1 Tax=Pannus brasiliensis CCIBt3594 TaxID=1427578 RepID=A0AAW9QNH7_9CHRO
MKPDFDAMSVTELKAYVLDHKQDTEAFYRLVDRLEAENPDSPWYPSPTTPEGFAIMEKALQERMKKREE